MDVKVTPVPAVLLASIVGFVLISAVNVEFEAEG